MINKASFFPAKKPKKEISKLSVETMQNIVEVCEPGFSQAGENTPAVNQLSTPITDDEIESILSGKDTVVNTTIPANYTDSDGKKLNHSKLISTLQGTVVELISTSQKKATAVINHVVTHHTDQMNLSVKQYVD